MKLYMTKTELVKHSYSLHRVTSHMYEWKCGNGIKRLVLSVICISRAPETVFIFSSHWKFKIYDT